MIKKTLYFGNPAYLSLRNEQMVIRLPEIEHSTLSEEMKKEAVRTIPIEDLGVVVLDNKQITITQGLMSALLDNVVAVCFCLFRVTHFIKSDFAISSNRVSLCVSNYGNKR